MQGVQMVLAHPIIYSIDLKNPTAMGLNMLV
jgi:hypothetical protein